MWRRLEAKLRNERSVGIHCRASIGRAGLVVVGTLFLGVAEELAWQHASLARGRQGPNTDEQRLWVSKAFRQSSATSALPWLSI
jgi:protein-tyrosine phosphatase